MNYTVVATKIDPQTKKEAMETAKELGTPEFSARDEEPNEYLIKTIKQALKDKKTGKASPIFNTGKEAVKWLEQQGI